MRLLSSLDVEGKRVLMRADFNVPIKDGKIQDDFRIRAYIPTIRYLEHRHAKIILISHLGEPEGVDLQFSLKPIAERLSQLLDKNVAFASDIIGASAKEHVADLQGGEIVLLENLRFDPGEKANDENFAHTLALLADCYVDDAFSASHRPHASIIAFLSYCLPRQGFYYKKKSKCLSACARIPFLLLYCSWEVRR
jgi:3-phosphoglycerate kinase